MANDAKGTIYSIFANIKSKKFWTRFKTIQLIFQDLQVIFPNTKLMAPTRIFLNIQLTCPGIFGAIQPRGEWNYGGTICSQCFQSASFIRPALTHLTPIMTTIEEVMMPKKIIQTITNFTTCMFDRYFLCQLFKHILCWICFILIKNKGIGDAGSTADIRMLWPWSALVCLGLL